MKAFHRKFKLQYPTLHAIQITDLHLLEDEDARLKNTAAWQTFRAVLQHAVREGPQPDFILATGDLAHERPRVVYGRLQADIAGMGIPMYVAPGNHDDPALLAEVFSQATHQGSAANGSTTGKVAGVPPDTAPMEMTDGGASVGFGHVSRGNWLVILLDTVVPRMEHGLLSAGELARLDALLHTHPRAHALVCLHHHPVPFGRAGMDAIGLRNAEAFFSIVDRHPQVRGIVWGHIHNAFEAKRGEIMLLGAPSTCFQFDAASERISPIESPPGYRRLTLEPDGRIDSHVVWV